MKKIIFIIACIFTCCFSGAQPLNTNTDFGLYEHHEAKMLRTLDSGFVVVGRMQLGSSFFSSAIYKFNTEGTLQWTRTCNMDYYDRADGVVQLPDSSYYIVSSNNSFNTSFMDFAIIHLSSNGIPISWYNYSCLDSSSLQSTDVATNISMAADGNFIVGGITTLDGSTSVDYAFLLKADTAGNVLWASKLVLGNTWFNNHFVTQSGNIVAGGKLGTSLANFFYALFDSLGNDIYIKGIGFSSSNEIPLDIQPTPDGGIIMGGITNRISSLYDNIIIKINAAGNFQWSKVFGCAYADELRAIRVLPDGSMLITGASKINGIENSSTLFKFDVNGNLLWSKYFGVPLHHITGFAVLVSPADSSIFLAGTDNNGASGSWLLYLAHIVNNSQTTCIYMPFTSFDTAVYPVTTIFSGIVHPVFHSNFTFTPLTSSLNLNSSDLCIVTGSNTETDRNNVILFPNPATNELVVGSSEFGDKSELAIFNTLGVQVFFQPQTSNLKPQTVDVSQLPSGIYFVKIRGEKGELLGKFVKQ